MTEYEFSQEENLVVDTLAKRLRLFGVFIIIVGLITTIGVFVGGFGTDFGSITSLIEGISFLVIGITLYRPTDNLKRVVSSTGNDISEVMTAFSEMSSGFKIALVLFVINNIVLLVDLFI